MKRKIIPLILIAIALAFCIVPGTSMAASADVTYSYWDGTEWKTDTKNAELLTNASSQLNANGWFYVEDDIILTSFTVNSPDVNLILKNSSTLTISGGLTITLNSKLTIYAESGATAATEGFLTATGNGSGAGIDLSGGGELIAYGGNITATGGDTGGMGINANLSGVLTIYGGDIKVNGGNLGAGIGINAGTVNMIGGHLTVNGTDGAPVTYEDADDEEITTPIASDEFDRISISEQDTNGNSLASDGVEVTVKDNPGVEHKFRSDALGRITLILPVAQDDTYDELIAEKPGYCKLTLEDYELDSTYGIRMWKTLVESVLPAGNSVPISTNKLMVSFADDIIPGIGNIAIDNGATVSSTPSNNPNAPEGYEIFDLSGLRYNTTYTVTFSNFKSNSYTMTEAYAHTFTTGYPPPPQPDPEPDPKPGPNRTLTLTTEDLDRMLRESPDGIMLLIIEGDVDSLNLDVPLSWFMENLGATLLVYNEGLGLLAITSENMIELASQAYNGEEGGVTVVINGKEVTFLPDTLISYLLVRGSITLTVSAEGESMKWYVYDSPLILGIPDDVRGVIDENLLVAFVYTEDGGTRLIPRSYVKDGLVYLLVNNEGRFDILYNPVLFLDVGGGWIGQAVNFVAARGIMVGVGDMMFDPSGELTRAQYVTMLMRMLDFEITDFPEMPFTDIDPDSWYYESVCKAAELGIIYGVGDGLFDPHVPVSRQDMFTMTYRAMLKFYIIIPETVDESTLTPVVFSDDDEISDYAAESISELSSRGIVNGFEGMVMPRRPMTRAEAAQLMTNIIKFIVPDYSEKLAELEAAEAEEQE